MISTPVTSQFDLVAGIIKIGHELGVVVRVFPDSSTATIISRCNIEQFDGDCVLTFFREQFVLQLLGKRLMDFWGALFLLVLLSPFLVCIAIAIKVSSPGPILFIQPRVGMNKRSFNLYKFRSMYVDAEKHRKELSHLNEMDGPVFKIRNDPRVTPLGRFIRKWEHR